MPVVVPGVLVPDAPVSVSDRPDAVRLRQLVRDGLLALTTEGVDVVEIAIALKEATEAPTRVLRLADIDVDHVLADALAAQPEETWLLRPDGHVAAVLTSATSADLVTAARRATGATS
jgi:hypothetical protein